MPPVAVASAAALGERDRPGQIAALLGPGGGHRLVLPEGGPLGRVGEAADGRAATGAAGVPADDVEAAAGEGVEGLAAFGDHGDAGVAGPARVDEQRPDPLAGAAGQVADDGQGDGAAPGAVPVQRHGHAGALQPRPARRPDGRGRLGTGRSLGRDPGLGGEGGEEGEGRAGGQQPDRHGAPVTAAAGRASRPYDQRPAGTREVNSPLMRTAPTTRCMAIRATASAPSDR